MATCLSAKDSNTRCRFARSSSSRGQQAEDYDSEVDDVNRLPDTVVVEQPSSDIIERVLENKKKKHNETLEQLDTELTALTQVCESQVKTISLHLLSSLQEVDLSVEALKDKMDQLQHVSLQEVHGLWEEVEEQVKLKKLRIAEFSQRLTDSETQRTNQIRALLRTCCQQLEKLHFLTHGDIHRLIHSQAMMLNQSLLVNRRSVARLLLLLQEENLHQQTLLRLHWEESLSGWRHRRVNQVIDRFRRVCSVDQDQRLVLEQQAIQETRQSQQHLTDRRRHIIRDISSLVPPSCSPALVSDWYSQLSAANQEIEHLHTDLLRQLRCCYEQMWQDRLAELQRCREALAALRFSQDEVTEVIDSQLLALFRQSQTQDEQRLAALNLWSNSLFRTAVSLSRCVFAVMRGAVLLWEIHTRSLERREEEIQRHLDELRHSLGQYVQKKKVYLNKLLSNLRQGSCEDELRTMLDKTVRYLQDIKDSYRQSLPDQLRVLDRLPSVFLEELLSYGTSLASFYHLSNTYTPSPEELHNFNPPPTNTTNTSAPGTSLDVANDPEETMEEHADGGQEDADPAKPSHDWLVEAKSSLLELCDISSHVHFTSAGGVSYAGPAFRCPALNPPENMPKETHLSAFPVELLAHTLSRTRTLFLDHLEQCFRDSSVVARVTERKAALHSDQELQLQHLDPQHIEANIYQPRLGELQLHRQRVDTHCQLVSDVMQSCRAELQQLQASINRKYEELSVTLSSMEEDIVKTRHTTRLEALSASLQDCLDNHIKDTQYCQTAFRQMVMMRLKEVRHRTTQLLHSIRLFSEGGQFAPQELKLFQKRLMEETKQISLSEEAVYTELEAFESKSLQLVKEASNRLKMKLSLLQYEVTFVEKIQKIISTAQVQIKAKAALINQQQSVISGRLEELRRTLEDGGEVSLDQVCLLLSFVNEELRKRHLYLDFTLDSLVPAPQRPPQESLPPSDPPTSRKSILLAPPPGLLLASSPGRNILEDPVVGVVKSLNSGPDRPGTAQDAAPEREPRTAAGQNSAHQPHPSASTLRYIKLFGVRPEPDQNLDSFYYGVTFVLWAAYDATVAVARDFYRSEHCSKFHIHPSTLDQWADGVQQRLLGYLEQAKTLLSTSRKDLVELQRTFLEMLRSLPAVLICNHERQQGAELQEEAGRLRQALEEKMAASEREKRQNVRQLRASLSDGELRALVGGEELRQERLHGAVCCSHRELQECVKRRGETFVASLASMSETLLHQLDHLVLPPTETESASLHPSGDSAVTVETKQEACSHRTWAGIPHLSPPTCSTADSSASVTLATTASVTTTRCTPEHLAVVEQRDAALKRFEQLYRSELSRSDMDRSQQLCQLQSWATHWRRQIDAATHTPSAGAGANTPGVL